MAKEDYYQILGVDRSADAATIKKAYRQQAMKFHPDKNPGDKAAEEKFKQAAEAYDVLSDPQKKARYDQYGHAGMGMGGGGGPGGGAYSGGFHDVSDIFESFGDIFGDFFGGQTAGGSRRGSSRRSGPRKGSDLRYFLDITLKDSYLGLSKDIEFESEKDCGTCKGSGAKPGTSPQVCQYCGGTGQLVQKQGFFSFATTCHHCSGSGQMIVDKCSTCRGSGRENFMRKLNISVPAGIEDGTQLRVTGEGDAGKQGGPKGDLYVVIRVKDDKKFYRQGLDLYGEVEVSYLQALLGVDKKIETYEGEQVLNIKPGTSPNDILRIKKRGFPALRGGARGDLMLKIKVKFPSVLSAKEEKALRDIAKDKGEDVKGKSWF